jgi:signal transduction histidine kinase
MDYAADTPAGLTYFRMNVAPIAYGNARVAISHTNITDLQLSKEKDYKRLQQFARRLIHAQEEERQRIAREIHDDLGNRIALMSLSVREVMKQASLGNTSSTVGRLGKVLDSLSDLSTVLRNLSHWLHPAVLRCLGIPAALRMLQEGFHETHGIQMEVVVPPDMPRLSDEVELCIFRITQECIQNVSKHSGADKVRIVLEYKHRWVRLTVSDTGRGFIRSEAATHNGGLGLQSMEERALSIRGRLTVKTAPGAGTQIRLTIPVHDNVIAAHT